MADSKILASESYSEGELKKKTQLVTDIFEVEKGTLVWPGFRDPLAGLVQTLLTHNTTDANAFPAYDEMRSKFPNWKDIDEASGEEIAFTIKRAGLQNQKAKRIKALLAFVKEEFGKYTADSLKGMSFDEALKSFGHLPGVKHKTLAVVLCFDLGVDVFPVDTHVHRVCKRLGLVSEKGDAVKTFNAMRALVPAGKSYQLHIHMIRHGRELCFARKPNCESCFLAKECLFFQQMKKKNI